MRDDRFKKDYVKMSSYIFIDRYNRRLSMDPSGVLFNKFMTLLYKDLKNNLGIDMKLPHCWYRWGDVVVKQSLPYLCWNHSDTNGTTVSFRDEFDLPSKKDEAVGFITKYADDFIDKYGKGSEGVELAIDVVYDDAPLDFQRDYRRLRDALRIWKTNEPYDNQREYIRSLFDTAMSSFPMREFRRLDTQRTWFSSVFGYCLDNGTSNTDLFDIAEDFWFFFCYHLRLKFNENVGRDIKSHWRGMLPMECSRYEASIQNYAHQFCSDSDDTVIQQLLSGREKRLSELEELLKELD